MRKGVKNSAETKAKISASVKLAYQEGRISRSKAGFNHTPETRAKIGATHKRLAAEGKRKDVGLSTRWTSEQGKTLRRAQILHEEAEANKLRAAGYEVFSPTIVCDRIAIKDGKVYFIEFKKPRQLLREGQKRVSDVAGDQYLIVYSEA
jgi:hypothetical protein